MEAIRLTAAVYAAMIQHAYATLPAEAVGLLGGPAQGYATHSIPLPNRAGRYTFFADPFAQFQAERQLAQLRLEFLAVYHSHPGGGARLSPLDLAFARRRACLQIVIALQRTHLVGEEIRAYRVVKDEAIAVDLFVEDKKH